jgi:mannose-1-phosphate guanylyltransferase/mannose-6-phosphate isomerase
MQRIIPIILSGGFGTRLWPLSRQKMPKQFLNIADKKTLFSRALNLVSNQNIFLPPMVVTNEGHKFFVVEEYKKLGLKIENIILEPCAKNTAIAIMVACILAQKTYNQKNTKLLILPSDHLIDPKELFEESVLNGAEVIVDNIVTFGINPSFACTGYGYIKKSQKISQHCFKIEEFIEKPNQKKAELFLQDGRYLWNGGIFLLQSDVYLAESKKFLDNQLAVAIKSVENAKYQNGFYTIDQKTYEQAEEISVDYGILEKSKNIAVAELKSNWSDVGDFNAIYKTSSKDENANAKFGNVQMYDSKNSLIYSNRSLIACLGLDNIIVVESDDAILIANKDRAQDIKKIVSDLSIKDNDKVKLHNRVFRPWGYYETLINDNLFKVKKILVNSNSSLSLQSHQFRSEHWVVVKGTAFVTCGDKEFNLNCGESTFIKSKTKHRLANKTDKELKIIEVQIGSYLEEDDIVRFEDIYGR